jgi:hypothetical protein
MASHQISNHKNSSKSSPSKAAYQKSPIVDDDADSSFGSVSDIADYASACVSRGASQVREMTRDREGTVVAVALAAGLGLGLVIGASLASSRREQRTWLDRKTAEGFGRRLMDKIEGMLPDALSEHFSK